MSATGGTVSPGTRIADRYEVLDRLGSSPHGEVFRVFDHHLAAEMALKLLKPKHGQPATWDEAKLLKRLESEYLLPVYNADVASPADLRYITMPFMPGGDLERRARGSGVPPAQAIRWGVQVAHGLQRVHDEGLLHRDVKPANAFLTDANDAALGDLGLAVQIGSDGTSPPDGTPQTVAPEVLGSTGRCTIRSDIYSLAATVFYLLAGAYAVYNRGDVGDVLRRVMAGERRRVRDLAPHVSQSLGAVIERNLSPNPADRAPTARDFANQLGRTRSHRRDWSLVQGHDAHLLCLRGEAMRLRQAIEVCTVPAGSAWSIEVRRVGGSRMRRKEVGGLTHDKALAALRKLAAEL